MAPEGLGARLRARGCRWGSFVLAIQETDSTNRLASDLARHGAPHGSLVVAETQSAGKGRWSRRWESPRGGLYLSAVLRGDDSVGGKEDSPGRLPFVAAVASAEALERFLSAPVRLCWPNDLYFDRRKIGGILSESSFTGSKLDFAVVGIGLNVNHKDGDFAPELARRATSMRQIVGVSLDVLEVAAELVSRFEAWWEHRREGLVLERWLALASGTQGSLVRVVSKDGDAFEAVTDGLAPDGGLKVRLADGTERILYSDDVHLLE